MPTLTVYDKISKIRLPVFFGMFHRDRILVNMYDHKLRYRIERPYLEWNRSWKEDGRSVFIIALVICMEKYWVRSTCNIPTHRAEGRLTMPKHTCFRVHPLELAWIQISWSSHPFDTIQPILCRPTFWMKETITCNLPKPVSIISVSFKHSLLILMHEN